MSIPVALTTEHIARAYAQLRRHDWPTLAELERCHKLYLIVRGQAVNVAEGRPMPREPTATAVPMPAPAPRAAAPPPQARRRDDRPLPFDPRAAAAGEYVHPDSESDNP